MKGDSGNERKLLFECRESGIDYKNLIFERKNNGNSNR